MTTLVDGQYHETVSVDDRGLQYGDGLFETMRVENRRIAFWRAHFNRLSRSAERLGISCPSATIWLEDISRLLDRYGDGIIKLILTRGAGERGYRHRKNCRSTRIVRHFPLPEKPYFLRGVDDVAIDPRFAATLCVCRTPVSVNPSLAGMKHLNRLENVLARQEWTDEYTEGLMLDERGNVVEGTMSNLFAIRNGAIFTPSLQRAGVAGVIRSQIIEQAARNARPVTVDDLSLDALFSMDEWFICNSIVEIWPVNNIHFNGRVWQNNDCSHTSDIHHWLQAIKSRNDQQC